MGSDPAGKESRVTLGSMLRRAWPTCLGILAVAGSIAVAVDATGWLVDGSTATADARDDTAVSVSESVGGAVAAEVAPPPAGTSVVAAASEGSSDPTYYPTNHRLVRTAAGRTIAIHGRHLEGVQLAWSDGTGWRRSTRGAAARGILLGGTWTGDWPASIAIIDAADGSQHAWVAWSGTLFAGEQPRPVEVVHLTGLDAWSGPRASRAFTVAEPGLGNGRADIGFERLPDGSVRGHLAWVQRTGDGTEQVVTSSFDDVTSDAPTFSPPVALGPPTTERSWTTVVESPAGVRIATGAAASGLTIWRRDGDGGATSWSPHATGVATAPKARPSIAALDDGSLLIAADTDVAQQVSSVWHVSANGDVDPRRFDAAGYREPAVTTDGTRAWVVMVRASDGFVISRELDGGIWSDDVVEIGPEGGGNHRWPNVPRRVDDALTFLVRGPQGDPESSPTAVLARHRPL
jgi:hypothetical protein